MPVRHRGRIVNRIEHRGRDVRNLSYPTDDAHTFADDGNSDALAPLTSGTFLFEHAMVTVTIDAAGNVTVSAVLAADTSVMITATTTADFTGSSPVNTATDRSVQVDLIVPTISPAFDNEGETVTGVLTMAQTVDPSDTCDIGDWTNSGAPFNSGSPTFGSCSAATTVNRTDMPCVETFTTSGTRRREQRRLQTQVRSVTRMVNGLTDLTNPCSGVATTQNVAATSVVTFPSCTRTATNTAYVSGTTEDAGVDQPTVWSGNCTGVDTSVGCCPDATCTGSGTEAGTIETIFTTTRNCDGSTVSTRSTTRNTSRACTDTYANPDTCACTTLAITGPTPATIDGSANGNSVTWTICVPVATATNVLVGSAGTYYDVSGSGTYANSGQVHTITATTQFAPFPDFVTAPVVQVLNADTFVLITNLTCTLV